MLRLVVVASLAGVVGFGCLGAPSPGESDASVDDGDRVGGNASGLLQPVALRVEYTGGDEILTVDSDGAFEFEHSFSAGDSYVVSLVGTPACMLGGTTGTVPSPGADVTDLTLLCDGVAALSALVIEDPLVANPLAPSPSFTPGILDYESAVSILAQAVTVTATTAFAEATMTLDGAEITTGEKTAALALDLGATALEVVVSHPAGFSRTYSMDVTRGGKIAQQAYAKAHQPGSDDSFGTSIAISGDTLAVGAPGDSSAETGPTPGAAGGADSDATNAGAVYVFRRSGAAWAQEAYIKPHNAEAGDGFGSVVALSGDTLAVGARNESSAATGVIPGAAGGSDNDAVDAGAVYVFRRGGASWAQQAYIKPHNTGSGDEFGFAISLSGDLLAVGAPLEASADAGVTAGSAGGADNDEYLSGAVYIFRRTGTEWHQEAYVKAHNPGSNDKFGRSVWLSGDALAVGAPYESSAGTGVKAGSAGGADDDAFGAGAVYVFKRDSAVWSQQAYVKAHNTKANDGDGFGNSVSLSGDTLAVGAPQESSADTGVRQAATGGTDTDATYAGAVYVFRWDGAVWNQEAYIKAHNTDARDRFGGALAVHGDTLAVAADGDDGSANGAGEDNDLNFSGAAYVFRRIGTTWSQADYAKAGNAGDRDAFGLSLALSFDALVVGAPLEDSADTGVTTGAAAGADNDTDRAGAAYIFH